MANIPNTWGVFSGDIAQWHSFRDRFKAAVHANNSVPIMFKFQYLKAAVQGAAAREMSSWNMTEENFSKAWDRLREAYEDDYMTVQALVRRILVIQSLERASSSGLQKMIDAVHGCLNQLSSFVTVTNWDPMIVFLVIDRLDAPTYEAWESYRIQLAKEKAAGEASDEASCSNSAETDFERRSRKEIPSWIQLEEFLKQRARMCMRAERRVPTTSHGESSGARSRDSSTGSARETSQKQKQKSSGNRTDVDARKARLAVNYPPCSVCNQDHALYRCNEFLGMNLGGRREHVKNAKLCDGCLKPEHEDACAQKKCNRCPNKQMHNSLLCPTREADRQSLMLVSAELGRNTAGAQQVAKKQKRKKDEN